MMHKDNALEHDYVNICFSGIYRCQETKNPRISVKQEKASAPKLTLKACIYVSSHANRHANFKDRVLMLADHLFKEIQQRHAEATSTSKSRISRGVHIYKGACRTRDGLANSVHPYLLPPFSPFFPDACLLQERSKSKSSSCACCGLAEAGSGAAATPAAQIVQFLVWSLPALLLLITAISLYRHIRAEAGAVFWPKHGQMKNSKTHHARVGQKLHVTLCMPWSIHVSGSGRALVHFVRVASCERYYGPAPVHLGPAVKVPANQRPIKGSELVGPAR
eukprot:1145526-Pelagomonas_calceolata.AAC.5